MNLQPADKLWEAVAAALKNELPFVVFSPPESTRVTGYFQKDGKLVKANDDHSSGFLFAPFSEDYPVVLIPSDSIVHAEIGDLTPPESTKDQVQDIIGEDNTRKKHITLLSEALRSLKSGKLDKVVLSRKLLIPRSERDIISVFKGLLSRYPTAFRYLWHHPEVGTWVGATPETLVKIEEGMLETMSLAGTQPYRGSMDVSWGPKEKEEQAMVTRSILNRLYPHCLHVQAGDTRTVKAGKLLHLLTPVKAVLTSQELPLEEIVAALHPTPAVCGLPRKKAKKFILEHEGYDRKYYTGYLGPLSKQGSAELYVNLRCMEITDEAFSIYVGGGITKDSDPDAEWEETVNKSKTMLAVL
ncbi:isochorismate synthase [Robertkochia marina]|uniref:isochorismate synthase n=1 Tax=Robertkochia marina TaxID=1227945 RepID=A0A4S3M2Q5_9FLAO|nr:isochorismate synthase [Robertkochia marina]THD67765.1 isochorismate synthase [Robertkochia marina]TRZ40930.1 isochorismate synthase [Robertkochia marina]